MFHFALLRVLCFVRVCFVLFRLVLVACLHGCLLGWLAGRLAGWLADWFAGGVFIVSVAGCCLVFAGGNGRLLIVVATAVPVEGPHCGPGCGAAPIC